VNALDEIATTWFSGSSWNTWWEAAMRFLAVGVSLCISAATASQAAATPPCSACGILHVAPAPVIGAGIPAFLIVGALLLGAKLVKRWQRS
jgi:hypothetical protein